MKKLAGGGGIFLGIVIIVFTVAACAGGGGNAPAAITPESTAPDDIQTVTPSAPVSAPAATPAVTTPALELKSLPVTFKGSGDMKTPPFTATTDEWVIAWAYTPVNHFASFTFYVYPEGEATVYVNELVSPGAESGAVRHYTGAGDFYIDVSADSVESWEITVRPVQ